MITPLPRFLRRADAPRSVQSLPEKTRLTVQFGNLSTALETCFALPAWARSPTQAGPSRLRFSVQTVNFTFHNRPPPTSQRALEKPESRVQTVNFTIVGDHLMAMQSRLDALQLRVWFVNFTFHNWLCAQILTASVIARFTVLFVNHTTVRRTNPMSSAPLLCPYFAACTHAQTGAKGGANEVGQNRPRQKAKRLKGAGISCSETP